MRKCGTCANFTECIAEEDDDSCCDYYPDVYMEINHSEEWSEYEKKLNRE